MCPLHRRAETRRPHWVDFGILFFPDGAGGLLAPFSSPGDGGAARVWAYHHACCLPPSRLALLGLARPATVCDAWYSCLSRGGGDTDRMSEPSRARRLAFRSKLCSLGLSFSSSTVGRGGGSLSSALCSSENNTILSGCFTRDEGVIR